MTFQATVQRVRYLPRLYRRHFADCRKERQFLSATAFFATFTTTRTITHAIRAERGPFRNITPGGRHIHHMTFGISGLLGVGWLWMLQIGTSGERRSTSRATSLTYGMASALTLDEFALWLDLQDDYWTPAGRKSIEAVALFGTVLTIGLLGGNFLSDLRRIGHAEDPEAELERLAEHPSPAPAFLPRRLASYLEPVDSLTPP